jgi:hypothetical protein
MTLSLISPVGSNFIKDFPEQNATNLDRIDAYANASLTTHPMKTFTPGLTASTTAPTLGTGSINRAFYYEIFDQIYIWGEFRFGTSGIAVGSGVYIVQLPFTVDDSGLSNTDIGYAPVVGSGATFDFSSINGSFPLEVHLRTTSQLMFSVRMNSGLGNREVRDSGLLTWSTQDGITWAVRFKRVP